MKEHKGKSGIYSITNRVDGKVYVGKTKDFRRRMYQYETSFRTQRADHINSYLLASMNKYGFDSFEFKVIEFCTVGDCTEKEIYWMDYYRTCERDFGYNLRRDSRTGMIVHAETSKKISDRLRREWESGVRDGHSEKLRESWSRRDRDVQGAMLSKILTKYAYEVYLEETPTVVAYKELKEMGFQNIVSSYHKKNTTDAYCKGVRIRRLSLDKEWNVKTCNNIKDFGDDLDLDYYISEAEKLLIQ